MAALLIVPALRRQRQRVPKTNCLARLAELVSFRISEDPTSVNKVESDQESHSTSTSGLYTHLHTPTYIQIYIYTYPPHTYKQQHSIYNRIKNITRGTHSVKWVWELYNGNYLKSLRGKFKVILHHAHRLEKSILMSALSKLISVNYATSTVLSVET